MNTESVFFKVISKILQRVPPPRKIQEGESSANGTNASDIDGGMFGAWDELSKTNLNEAIKEALGNELSRRASSLDLSLKNILIADRA